MQPLFPLLWLIPLALIALLAIAFLPLLVPRNASTSDERFWSAGMFYVNPDDPALFVRKRYRLGYTLNFGNRWSWFVLALLAALAIVPVLVAVSAILNSRHLTG